MDAQCFYWPMLVFFQIGIGPLNKTVSSYKQPMIVLMHHCIFVHAEWVCASDLEQGIVGYVDGKRGETLGVVYLLLVKRAVLGWFAQSVGHRGEKAPGQVWWGVHAELHMNEMGKNALNFD